MYPAGLKAGRDPTPGPTRKPHPAGIRAYTGAGFDEVYIGQAGGEHGGFFDFYSTAVLPRLREG